MTISELSHQIEKHKAKIQATEDERLVNAHNIDKFRALTLKMEYDKGRLDVFKMLYLQEKNKHNDRKATKVSNKSRNT